MAKDNKIPLKDKDPRIRLRAITTYYIYQECFKKAGIIYDSKFEKEGWAGRLVRKLKDEFPDDASILHPRYEQYIRDRFAGACKCINNDESDNWMGYSKLNFYPLLQYAGAENYEEINTAFKQRVSPPLYFIEQITVGPVLNKQAVNVFLAAPDITAAHVGKISNIPFIYVSKPFGILDTLFTGIADDEGRIYFHENGDTECRGSSHFTIKKNDLLSARLFKMYHDQEELWVRVKYTRNDTVHEAYFAEPLPYSEPLTLLPPKKLINHFEAQLKKIGRL